MASGIPGDYEERFGSTCISTFYPHLSSVLSPIQCFPFQRFIPISAFYPHFSVLSSFQRFIPISAFYPHFSVLSPFQRFIPISAFYPHFSVLSPFQCFIPISVSVFSFRFSHSVSAFYPDPTLFPRREAKTRIRQRDWLKLAGEKIRREQVGSVPTFLCVCANKFAKWKIGLCLAQRSNFGIMTQFSDLYSPPTKKARRRDKKARRRDKKA